MSGMQKIRTPVPNPGNACARSRKFAAAAKSRQAKVRALLWISVSILSACVSGRSQLGELGAADSPPLIAPATLQGDHTASQIVHGAFGSRELTMSCVVTVHGEMLTVIGLTALGVRVFTVHYDGKQILVDRELSAPSQLPPERLLSDIQLVYWPLHTLQPVLQRAGWEITEPFSGTRRLRHGDTLVAEIHYDGADPWQGRSWLVNLQHSYTLGIQSTPMTAP